MVAKNRAPIADGQKAIFNFNQTRIILFVCHNAFSISIAFGYDSLLYKLYIATLL